MMNEELLEYGTVKNSSNGYAVVTLRENENCGECTAKIFCKTADSKGRELTVKDNIGIKKGAKVLISVSGKDILGASFLLYGLPLILIMAGVIAGTQIYNNNMEIYSSLTGVGLAALYFFIFSRFEKKKEHVISKIIRQVENAPTAEPDFSQ